MAREMRAEPEFLQAMRKHADHTEFACFIRNVTPCPVRLSVPFGQMEGRPQITETALQQLLAENARRYCAGSSEPLPHTAELEEDEMGGGPEVL
jgi:hypothetical protein